MLTPAYYPTRRILFDMNEAIRKNEAIHNQGTVSPGDMSAFKDRIDAFIKEFKVSREP